MTSRFSPPFFFPVWRPIILPRCQQLPRWSQPYLNPYMAENIALSILAQFTGENSSEFEKTVPCAKRIPRRDERVLEFRFIEPYFAQTELRSSWKQGSFGKLWTENSEAKKKEFCSVDWVKHRKLIKIKHFRRSSGSHTNYHCRSILASVFVLFFEKHHFDFSPPPISLFLLLQFQAVDCAEIMLDLWLQLAEIWGVGPT